MPRQIRLPQVRPSQLPEFLFLLEQRKIAYKLVELAPAAMLCIDGVQLDDYRIEDMKKHPEIAGMPIIVAETPRGTVVDGYHRLEAAKRRRTKKVTCLLVETNAVKLVGLIAEFAGVDPLALE